MTKVTPRFDYNIYGVPTMMHRTERVEAVMHTALDDGKDARSALNLMEEEQGKLLREDPEHRRKLRDVYDQADINFFSVTVSERNLARWYGLVSFIDWMHIVTSPGKAQEVIDDGDVAVLLNTQRLGEAIGEDVEEIERLYNFGVQVGQLTHNERNTLGDGCTARGDGGLSWIGVDAVEKMNDLGMVVDLAHCAKQTTMDALEVTDSPVAFSHTGSEEISPHDRMKSDEELEALADNDGWLGLLLLPSFIASGREDNVIEVFFEQLEYTRSILGIERIGLASDWGTMAPTVVPERLQEKLNEDYYEGYSWRKEHNVKSAQGFGPINQYSDFWKLRDEFEERGYSEEEIDYVFGKSFMEFWERVDVDTE